MDVRIVAATNQNLDVMIGQGRFRRDLYYRLRGTTHLLPPLRERRGDIAELAHYFLFVTIAGFAPKCDRSRRRRST